MAIYNLTYTTVHYITVRADSEQNATEIFQATRKSWPVIDEIFDSELQDEIKVERFGDKDEAFDTRFHLGTDEFMNDLLDVLEERVMDAEASVRVAERAMGIRKWPN